MPKPLTEEEKSQVASVRDRLYVQLLTNAKRITDVGTDPGKLADVIAETQADAARAYADITLLVARRK